MCAFYINLVVNGDVIKRFGGKDFYLIECITKLMQVNKMLTRLNLIGIDTIFMISRA
jgi:hypothetical protein